MPGWSAAPARDPELTEGVSTLSTPQERAEQKRLEKLAAIREQLDKGELTIRQMTPEERKQHPPRPATPRRRQS
jgi:hypothetical protein